MDVLFHAKIEINFEIPVAEVKKHLLASFLCRED
jgi:hypothetical protein